MQVKVKQLPICMCSSLEGGMQACRSTGDVFITTIIVVIITMIMIITIAMIRQQLNLTKAVSASLLLILKNIFTIALERSELL